MAKLCITRALSVDTVLVDKWKCITSLCFTSVSWTKAWGPLSLAYQMLCLFLSDYVLLNNTLNSFQWFKIRTKLGLQSQCTMECAIVHLQWSTLFCEFEVDWHLSLERGILVCWFWKVVSVPDNPVLLLRKAQLFSLVVVTSVNSWVSQGLEALSLLGLLWLYWLCNSLLYH